MNYKYQTKDDQAYQRLISESKKFNRIGWITFVIVIVVFITVSLIGNIKGIVIDLIGIVSAIPLIYFMVLSESKERKARKLVIQPEFPCYQSDEKYYKKFKLTNKYFMWISSIGFILFLGYSFMVAAFDFNPLKFPMMYIVIMAALFGIIGFLTVLSDEYIDNLREQYLKYHQGDQEKE